MQATLLGFSKCYTQHLLTTWRTAVVVRDKLSPSAGPGHVTKLSNIRVKHLPKVLQQLGQSTPAALTALSTPAPPPLLRTIDPNNSGLHVLLLGLRGPRDLSTSELQDQLISARGLPVFAWERVGTVPYDVCTGPTDDEGKGLGSSLKWGARNAWLWLDGALSDQLLCVEKATLHYEYQHALMFPGLPIGGMKSSSSSAAARNSSSSVATGPSPPPAACYPHLTSIQLHFEDSSVESFLRGDVLPSLERLALVSGHEDLLESTYCLASRWEEDVAMADAAEVEATRAGAADAGKRKINNVETEWDVQRPTTPKPPRTPPGFFCFPKLRELAINEGGVKHNVTPWGYWECFNKLGSLERLHFSGGYKNGLDGHVSDALPAVAGLKSLSLHSAWHCPDGLDQLKHLTHLDVTIMEGPDGVDGLGAWDLCGLESLREARFNGGGDNASLPKMDGSLMALERLVFTEMPTAVGSDDASDKDGLLEAQMAQYVMDYNHKAAAASVPAVNSIPKTPGSTARHGKFAPYDVLEILFAKWVEPCSEALPNLRVVQVGTSAVYNDEGDEGGSLLLDPRVGEGHGWVSSDGRAWRLSARLGRRQQVEGWKLGMVSHEEVKDARLVTWENYSVVLEAVWERV